MLRLPLQTMRDELFRVLMALGFQEDRAQLCARLFAESSLDGVYSHGLNRFPRFCRMVRNGSIDINAEPERISRAGTLEQWDGNLGPGNLNARACMGRAISIAKDCGMGGVALRNTNHWMRGGTYGWQAAEAGMIGICWTNTMQNMPAWGSDEPRIGNNPLVIAVPRKEGHVVLDISMAQFSYGALSSYQRAEKQLPVDGGFDTDGRLTRDPGAIMRSGRPLPIGFWKGSGFALTLDLIAALLSNGRTTHQISRDPLKEIGLSQVFLVFDPSANENDTADQSLADQVIDHFVRSNPAEAETTVRYPGQRTLETRRANLADGIPVEPSIWKEIIKM